LFAAIYTEIKKFGGFGGNSTLRDWRFQISNLKFKTNQASLFLYKLLPAQNLPRLFPMPFGNKIKLKNEFEKRAVNEY
jgi:hypothetical protein